MRRFGNISHTNLRLSSEQFFDEMGSDESISTSDQDLFLSPEPGRDSLADLDGPQRQRISRVLADGSEELMDSLVVSMVSVSASLPMRDDFLSCNRIIEVLLHYLG